MRDAQNSNLVTKEVLLQQPACTLQLEREWNEQGAACHSFKLYPSSAGKATGAAISLLSGEGHDVPRREIHYALYLFQRHGSGRQEKRVING